jgi:hypothetical protein
METQKANSLPEVETDSISICLEGQPTNDDHYEEGAPNLTLEAKMKPYNKTTSTVIGLYLAGTPKLQSITVIFTDPAIALLCSILHYVFFDRLHGLIASGAHASISQSYATFISLLLITLFKASLLGCVSLCSTQYLWRVLRGQPIALSTVESLFQMRHDPLKLFYCNTFLSLSFLLAAYTWIVPLATIYPSGALTINSTPFLLTESVQMSVPGLVFNSNFDPFMPDNVSRLATFARVSHNRSIGNDDQSTSGSVTLSTNLHVEMPRSFLVRLAQSVIAAGQIALGPPASLGENSTYILEFLGPQLSCRNVGIFNKTTPDLGRFTDLVLGEADRNPYSTELPGTMNMSAVDKMYHGHEDYEWQIFQQTVLGGPCIDSQVDSQGDSQTLDEKGASEAPGSKPPNGTYLVETSMTNCTDRYVRYITNVTYTKGVLSINYTMHDIEPQPVKDLGIVVVWEAASDEVLSGDGQLNKKASIDAVFAASPYFQRSKEYLKERFRYWNAYATYAAFVGAIESATLRECYTPDPMPKCDTEWPRSNGSRAEFGPVSCQQWNSRSKCIDVRLSRAATRAS